MYRILDVLTADQVDQLKAIAKRTPFVDGKITNPHNVAKQNLQLHEPEAYRESAALVQNALVSSQEFHDFAFPVVMCPPLLTRYEPGMKYGAHTDMAMIHLPNRTIRSDLSCTVFLNDPDSYEGGELKVAYGDSHMTFKLQPGQAIVYPSNTLHEVLPVTKGERLVSITFIQSRIPDPARRHLLFQLNEVAALEGLNMSHDNYTRLQWVQQSLLRDWADVPLA